MLLHVIIKHVLCAEREEDNEGIGHIVTFNLNAEIFYYGTENTRANSTKHYSLINWKEENSRSRDIATGNMY